MSVSFPLKTALRGRRGVCSDGKLFEGFLKLKSKCNHCGQDSTVADTVVDSACFVGFFVIKVLVPFHFLLSVTQIRILVMVIGYGFQLAATIGFGWFLLPLAKVVPFDLQIYHRVETAQFEGQAQN